MNTHNQTFLDHVRKTLANIQTEVRAKEIQRDSLNEQIEKLIATSYAYELVLERESKLSGKDYTLSLDWAKILKDKKREDQFIEIAKRKDGSIKINEVTDIIFNSGLIQSETRRNAYTVLYGKLAELVVKGIFEKTNAGEFKLVERKTESSPTQYILPTSITND